MAFTAQTPQPSLAWQFEYSNVDSVTGLAPSSQVSPGPAQLQGSAALVTNAPTSNTAVYFPGSGTMNLGTSSVNVDLTTSNIFVEYWVYLNSGISFPGIMSVGLSSGQWNWNMSFNGTTLNPRLGMKYNAANLNSSVAIAGFQTWSHVAFSFNNTSAGAGTAYLFVNGQPGGSMAVTGLQYFVTETARVAGYIDGTGSLNAYIRDLRVVQGGIVPVGNFTPDAAPFSYALPSYVTGSGSVVFTLLRQFITYVPGKYNQAISIGNVPGGSPTSNVSWTLPSLSSSGLSVSVWVNASAFSSSNSSQVVSLSALNPESDLRLYFNSGTTTATIATRYPFVLGSYIGPTSSAFSTGVWVHVVATVTESTTASNVISSYVNGVFVGSSSSATSIPRTFNKLTIASFCNGLFQSAFNGIIDDLRIFDRALTSAQVQAVFNQQGVPGRGVVQATPTYNAPLTGYSDLNRVYGLQRLNTAYTGNIINIRRSSDNTNVDFTVDSTNTSLVTASGGQSLSSWLGAGTANVVIWYDQSGNGRNLTQLTNGNQPGFSATTGLLYSTGLFMNFPDNMAITDVTYCVGYIQRGYNATGSDQWYKQDPFIAGERPGGTNDYGLVIGGNGLFGFGTGNTDGPASTISTNGSGVYSFMTCTRNSTTGQVLLYNGTGSGTSFTKNTGSLVGPSPTTMGQNTSGYTPTSLSADVSSFFMFNNVKSQPEIASIASRFVNSTFTASPVRLTGTPLFSQLSSAATSSAVGAFSLRAVNGLSPSGTARAVQVRNGTTSAVQDFYADRLGNLLTAPVVGQSLANWLGGATGYVTTWYDQSGRGNHATQATAANQPVIQKATKGPGYACVYTGNQWVSFGTLSTFQGTPFCISAVVTRTSNVANNGIIGLGTTSSGFTLSIEPLSATQDRFRTDFRKTTNLNVTYGIPVYVTGEGPLYPLCDYSSGFVNRIYNKAGTPAISGNGVDFLNTALTYIPSIGLSNARAPPNYYIGEIYEVLVFTNSLYDLDNTGRIITQIYNNQLSYTGT